MTAHRPPSATAHASRQTAIAAGVFFLITDFTAVAAAVFYAPILTNSSYITGSGSDTQVLLGVLLEIILALGVVGTSVALFPVVKRWNESIALGYVGLRTLEAGIIAVGVVPLLAVVTLRQEFIGSAGTDTASLVTVGSALVEFYKWTLLVGPGLVCGVNTVLMAYLMYRSGLVPRLIPVLGLVGGPLVFALNVAKMFGAFEQMPPWAVLAVLPIFAWEVTLATWLITRGFRKSAIAAEPAQNAVRERLSLA